MTASPHTPAPRRGTAVHSQAGKRLEILALALALAAACGCAGKPIRSDVASGMFDEATIAYSVPTAHLQEVWQAAAPTIEQASFAADRPQPPETIKAGSLSLVYPHPVGGPARAQARLEFVATTEHSGWLPWRAQEPQTWVLDLTRAEFQSLVAQLRQAELYEAKTVPFSRAHVETTFDGESKRFTCDRVAALDELVQRIRREGFPVHRPVAPEFKGELVAAPPSLGPNETPSSVLALRRHEAQAAEAGPTASAAPLMCRLPPVTPEPARE